MSALPAIVEEQPAGHTEVDGHVEQTLLGLGAEGWVYTSITIFFVLAFVVAKLHRRIADALDAQIAEKRANLDEAAKIRAEAQALLDGARKSHAESAREAELMLEHAKHEAEQIVAQAEADTGALIERRAAMAEAKIAAAELAAADALRREAAGAAIAAAQSVIAETHGETADRELAEKVIAGI